MDYGDYWLRREAGPDKAGLSRKGPDSDSHHRNQIAVRLIPEGVKVLDVGCGPGKLLATLQRHRPDLELHGIDISPEAIRIAKERGFNAECVDPVREPLAESYDTICLMTVLEHVPDAEALVRILKPRCRRQFLIAIPNLGYIEHRLRLALFGRMPLTSIWYDIREHVRFWTVKDFRHWADAMGLRVVGIHGTHRNPLRRRLPSLLASQIVYDLRSAG